MEGLEFSRDKILQLPFYFHAKWMFSQCNPLIRPHKMAFTFNCLLFPGPTNSIRFAEKKASSYYKSVNFISSYCPLSLHTGRAQQGQLKRLVNCLRNCKFKVRLREQGIAGRRKPVVERQDPFLQILDYSGLRLLLLSFFSLVFLVQQYCC